MTLFFVVAIVFVVVDVTPPNDNNKHFVPPCVIIQVSSACVNGRENKVETFFSDIHQTLEKMSNTFYFLVKP